MMEKLNLFQILSRELIRESEDKTTSVPSADSITSEDWSGDVLQAKKRQVGVKRKKIQVEEGQRFLQGWTLEQELAVERAYLQQKPTPHFWKNVAKMVAQEYSDKIHSEFLTPPQPKEQSRAKGIKSSFSLSASKLNASEPKMKKLRQSKQKSHLMHRTVRQLLQKQYKSDQDNEVDLFTIVEPTLDQLLNLFRNSIFYP